MRSPLFASYAVLFSKAVTSGFQRSKDIFRAIFINIENLTVHMLRNIRITIQVSSRFDAVLFTFFSSIFLFNKSTRRCAAGPADLDWQNGKCASVWSNGFQ